MAASVDSSLLFSLKELEQIEQGRVARERADSEARREAERAVHLERERLVREAETRRLEERERQMRAEEARRREEQGRLAAIERAEVEKARAGVEVRARAELERARAAHDLSIEAARGRGRLRTYRALLAGSVLITFAATASAFALSAQLRERERLDGQRAEIETAERDQHQRTLHALETSRALVDDLERKILALGPKSALPGVEPHSDALPPSVSSPTRTPKAPVLPKRKPDRACGLDGDPLNGCLPSH
jgi:hypothetical protein